MPSTAIVALALLRKLGYDAMAATNGAEAIEAVRNSGLRPGADGLRDTGVDGFESTRERSPRHSPGSSDHRLTADAMPSDRDRCLSEGMNDYLAKPVELGQLAELSQMAPRGRRPGATPTSATYLERERSGAVFDPEVLLER